MCICGGGGGLVGACALEHIGKPYYIYHLQDNGLYKSAWIKR